MPGGEGFDFEAFLTSRDTLYLVASDSATSPVSPLFVALLAELTHHARLHPARTGATRLDPPLSMELDEVANVAPIPVANWATWAAGSGIRIALYAQAWAQIEARWGKEGAATIWQAAKTKVIFTAGSEDALCELVSTLCGKVRVREEDDITYDRHGRQHHRRRYELIDVLPVAAVRQLPDGRAILIRRNAKPTIVRTETWWKRADVKAWRRSGGQIQLPAPIQRAIPAVRPDIAEQVTAARAAAGQLPRRDDLAERRAKRSPRSAPPLPLPGRDEAWVVDDQPPADSPPPAAADGGTDTEPWRPWHGSAGE